MRANILDFGAKSQEDFLNTDAIQKAIDYVNENGGGQVVIPAGDYLSGALCLKSNIDFHLEAGACLISSLTEEDFPKFMDDFEDDNEDTGWEDGCFLMARHETNISITGLGKIDGRGREVFMRTMMMVEAMRALSKLKALDLECPSLRMSPA